jgi:hypothetical protein
MQICIELSLDRRPALCASNNALRYVSSDNALRYTDNQLNTPHPIAQGMAP